LGLLSESVQGENDGGFVNLSPKWDVDVSPTDSFANFTTIKPTLSATFKTGETYYVRYSAVGNYPPGAGYPTPTIPQGRPIPPQEPTDEPQPPEDNPPGRRFLWEMGQLAGQISRKFARGEMAIDANGTKLVDFLWSMRGGNRTGYHDFAARTKDGIEHSITVTTLPGGAVRDFGIGRANTPGNLPYLSLPPPAELEKPGGQNASLYTKTGGYPLRISYREEIYWQEMPSAKEQEEMLEVMHSFNEVLDRPIQHVRSGTYMAENTKKAPVEPGRGLKNQLYFLA